MSAVAEKKKLIKGGAFLIEDAVPLARLEDDPSLVMSCLTPPAHAVNIYKRIVGLLTVFCKPDNGKRCRQAQAQHNGKKFF